VGAGVALLSLYFHHRATAETRARIENVSIPVGTAAGTFVAVNRVSAPLWPSRKTDRRPYALAAAAVGAWLASKELAPATPSVGRLPERTFEPPFPPPFGPPFDPAFEG